MYWNDLDHHRGEILDQFWMSHQAVRERINQRVAGDPGCWPTQWFRERFADRLPLRRAISVGCGTGALERDLVRQGIVLQVTGIDLAERPLALARAEAEAAGAGGAITYLAADARQFLRRCDGLDAVFFHASLHHFDRLSELLGLVRRALLPNGLLYLDEYVGPSMSDWGPRSLFLPNLLYYLLPKSLRRPRLVRTPINAEDPTEGVCAAEILGAVEAHFQTLERRDYGGDFLQLIHPNLRRPGMGPKAPSREEFDSAIRFLLDCEDLCLRNPAITRSRSHHTVLVAEPRR